MVDDNWEFGEKNYICAMKHQIIYLLGAGASYTKENNSSLPLANKFKENFSQLSKYDYDLENYDIKRLMSYILYEGKVIKHTFKTFMDEISQFNTIDEAMRFIYMNADWPKFKRYKEILNVIFYFFENIGNYRDPRYKQFLMTILEDEFKLPENVNILSWNYDNQFEHACNELQLDKKKAKKKPIIGDKNFFKINGTATYSEDSFDGYLYKTKDKNIIGTKNDEELQNFYKFIDNRQNIDFAWEKEFKLKFEERIKKISEFRKPETNNILVVIGYSFPYINHKFDLAIIKAISPSKIYIQNPEFNKDEFLETMGIGYMEKNTEMIINCNKFYIPREMYSGFIKKTGEFDLL